MVGVAALLVVFTPMRPDDLWQAYLAAPWFTQPWFHDFGFGIFMAWNYWPYSLLVVGSAIGAWLWVKAAPNEEMQAYVEHIYALETALKQSRETAEQSTMSLDSLNAKLDELFARTAEVWLVINPINGIRRSNQQALRLGQRINPALQTLEGRSPHEILGSEVLLKAVHLATTENAVWQGEVELPQLQQWFMAWVLPFGTEVAVILRDVTPHHRDASFLHNTEILVRQLVEESTRPVVVTDKEWRYLYVSNKWGEVLGLEPGRQLLGQEHWLVSPSFPANRPQVVQQLLAGVLLGQNEERYTLGGREMLLSWSIRPWKDSAGMLGGYIMVANDVTETVRLRQQVQQAQERDNQLAYTDSLTGLPNRQLFNDRLTIALAQAYRQLGKLGVIFLDLDGFKAVNDSLGHDAGDLLLKQVAERLQSCLRASDTLARLGGDEFTMILHGIREARDAEVVVEKVLQVIRQPYNLNGNVVDKVGTSIGVALYPQHAAQAADLLKLADEAMYEAKMGGKNTFRFAKAKAAGESKLSDVKTS